MRCQVGPRPTPSGAKERKTEVENANLLTTNEYLKRDGRSLMEIAEAVMFRRRKRPSALSVYSASRRADLKEESRHEDD